MKRFGIILTILSFWVGCDSVKPRAMGADNELVVVAAFEDRDKIQQILTTILNDTLYTPEPYYRTVWVDRKISMMCGYRPVNNYY